MAFKRELTANFGAGRNVSGAAVRILHRVSGALVEYQARTTTGVSEIIAGAGIVAAYLTLPHKPVIVVFDTGEAEAERGYAAIPINEFAYQEGEVQASPAPTTSSFTGDSGLSATDGAYQDMFLEFVTGSLAGLHPIPVRSYVGATKAFTLLSALSAAPAAGDRFRLLGTR